MVQNQKHYKGGMFHYWLGCHNLQCITNLSFKSTDDDVFYVEHQLSAGPIWTSTKALERVEVMDYK
jgi:hypothetical protein